MIPRLKWPGFQLFYDEGTLDLRWSEAGMLDVRADRCVDASLRPASDDGSAQLMFRFRSAASGTTDLIVVRVGVPAAHVQETEHLVRQLRREHGVPDRQADEDEGGELSRVPAEAAGWVLAPTGSASENFFDEVMRRIEGDTG